MIAKHETWHECRGFVPYMLKNSIKFHFIRNERVVILYKNINNNVETPIYDISFNNILIEIKNAFKNKPFEHTDYYIMFMSDWIDLKNQILEKFNKSYNEVEKYFNEYSIEDILNNFNYWYSEITYDGKIKYNHPKLFTIYKNQIKQLQDGNKI